MSKVKTFIIYAFAFLFSFMIYWLFVLPLPFSNLFEQTFIVHLLIFLSLLIFPVLLAWLFTTRGLKALLIFMPFYVLGLFFLYRGFYMSGQFSLLDYLFLEVQNYYGESSANGEQAGSFIGIESFFLYIVISEFGVLLAYFRCPIDKVKKLGF